jgi:type II secretory pathway pseudopilin PulG
MRYPDSRGVGSATGFSMLEVLIAGAILLIISLGLIPLFVRAIRDNETGSDYTQVANGNKSRLEESSQLPINNQSLAVPAGAAEGQVVESYAQGNRAQVGDANEKWWPGAPTDKGQLLWTRTTRIHLYSMDALDKRARDYVLDTSERQLGASDTGDMGNNHLKEVEVVLDSDKTSAVFGGGKRTTYRLLKAF